MTRDWFSTEGKEKIYVNPKVILSIKISFDFQISLKMYNDAFKVIISSKTCFLENVEIDYR